MKNNKFNAKIGPVVFIWGIWTALTLFLIFHIKWCYTSGWDDSKYDLCGVDMLSPFIKYIPIWIVATIIASIITTIVNITVGDHD